MKKLGLIGYPLSHSFSKKYFTQKFIELGLSNEWSYSLLPLQNIEQLPGLLLNEPELVGFNVTIPHKISVLNYLDEIDEEAEKAGAVNTVKISIYGNNKKYLKGFNTDVYGFEMSLLEVLKPNHKNALILGTGGASKAVQFVLKKLGIAYTLVSRNALGGNLTYGDIDEAILKEHHLIINTTPLGMLPNINEAPDLPYEFLTRGHLLYDLVYNPAETLFLKKGIEAGAHICNGGKMLMLQAEKAWEIWQE